MDPAFRLMRSHSMAKLFFYLFILWKKMIFRKVLELPLIFVLFFLRENKIRKKALSVTPEGKYKSVKNWVWVQGSGYLLGRYGNDRSTPLSP